MESIYNRILAALEPDGTLPKDFSIQRSSFLKEGYAEGEADEKGCGVVFYGRVRALGDQLTEITRRVSSGGDTRKAAEDLAACFGERGRMWDCWLGFERWFRAYERELDSAVLFQFAVALLTESGHPEVVKYALVILTLVDGDEGAWQEAVRVLARSDELTRFCIPVIEHWESSSEELFAIAQKVRGWGRVHIVRALEPTNQEMRDWLLDEGWDNDVEPLCTALDCIRKGRLRERLEGDTLSGPQLDAARGLMWAFMDSIVFGIMINFEEMEDWRELLWAYLGQMERVELTPEDIKTVWRTFWLKNTEDWPELPQFQARAQALLENTNKKEAEKYERRRKEPVYQRVKEALKQEGALTETLQLETEANDLRGERNGNGWFRSLGGMQDCWYCYNGYDGEYYSEPEGTLQFEKMKKFARCAAGETDYEPWAESLLQCLLLERDMSGQEDWVAERLRWEQDNIFFCLSKLKDWLVQSREELDQEKLFAFAGRLLTESTSVEAVKYALTVLSVMENMPEELRDQVRTLAGCDEFTHYCAALIIKWEGGMEELFRIAQKLNGAGRTMAVRVLEPDSQEMRDWLLSEGWRGKYGICNIVKCINEGRLLELLKGPVTPEQLELATDIIRKFQEIRHCSQDELGTYVRTGGIRDWDQVILAWLGHLEKTKLDLEMLKLIRDFSSTAFHEEDLDDEENGFEWEYYGENKASEYDEEDGGADEEAESVWPQVHVLADRLLNREDSLMLVWMAMETDQDDDLGRALALDRRETALTYYEKATYLWHGSGCYEEGNFNELESLFNEGDPWTGRVIAVWERDLPVQMERRKKEFEKTEYYTETHVKKSLSLCYRPLRDAVWKLASCPGRGLSLVLLLLKASEPLSRGTALQVLIKWREQGWVWPLEVVRALKTALMRENYEMLRKQLKQALEPVE